MRYSIQIILASIILILFSSCDDSEFVSKNLSFSGAVVDGYVAGASVCLDVDKDGICSATEHNTTTSQNGKFSFTNIQKESNDYAVLISRGGKDTATDKVFDDELKNILDTQHMRADLVITPLTDLAAISFLAAPAQNYTTLNESRETVAKAYALSQNDLDKDPMQNVQLFLKVQELQYIKKLIQNVISTSIDQNTSTTEEQYILSKVKKAFLTQMQESSEESLDLYIVLTAMELEFSITIPMEAKDFIVSNFAELKTALSTLSEDPRLIVEILNRLQIFLEIIRDKSINTINLQEYNATIIAIDLDNIYSLITQTDFNTTDAIYDEQACLNNSVYQSIEDSSFDPGYVDDASNGIYINSTLPFDFDVENTRMKLFYPNLTVEKTNEKTIFFNKDYYLAFDQAWVLNDNKKVYLQTPTDNNGISECYRLNLSSKIASELTLTKVFRYSEL